MNLLLTQEDIDVNPKDLNWTSLWFAAARRHEAAELLLARKDVDVNSKDLYGWVPLSCDKLECVTQ